MKFYKQISDGYIVAIGTAESTVSGEITQAEYAQLAGMIAERPTAPEGKYYRLKADFTWELCDLPPAEAPEQYTQEALEWLSAAELETILAGYGISASMNKANMIRLILAAQGGDADA